ncbi:Vacuolar protein sorting-associated protein 54 [Trypanosoma melophagium]|uniref:Vacuolar protein sorting-associated protein 54 n=1 Tax=Trypanosoma melophagium TaxID=715481 RepID=UPI00351A6048|nr:Vacuolar protein sorting-associated protein 54 [Trypanosoma melophagium]
MDEMRDGISYAWKGAMRGAKKGYKMTKSVLRSIPVDRLRVPGASSVRKSSSALRRLFQLRYGAEINNEHGERIAAAEVSDVESEEEEALTEEQVHERVEKKFFDKSYDAMKYEITHMEVVLDNSDDVQQQQQRQLTEAAIRELRQKCDVVSATLKKRVLANRKGFVNGVEEIRLINDRLLETSSDCKKGRNFIRKAKNGAAEQMKILVYHRRRSNCAATLSLLTAMRDLCWKRNQLLTLLEGGKLIEAADLLRLQGDIEHEDRIKKLFCMSNIIDEWKNYRDNKNLLQKSQEAALHECLTAKFIPSKYRNAFEASNILGTVDHIPSLIAQTLWQSAVYILTKSLIEVSHVKDEEACIADIAAAIDPDHLMLCLCQMSAKMMDFLFLFATVRKIHDDDSRLDHHPLAPLHAATIQEINHVGQKLGHDLVEKITLVLEKSRFEFVDVERVLHIYFVVSMLIEAISVLGLEKSDQSNARAQIKTSLVKYITHQFQEPKAAQILNFMADDAWVVDDMSALDMQVVVPIHPETYRRTVKEVKAYIAEASIESPGSRENPFYTAQMLVLQDTARTVKTESFREEIARRGVYDVSSLLTPSAVALANVLLEYVARIVARFAPLAAETVAWAEDLISLYLYTVADNFVSISRTVRLENQGDFSEATQIMLAEMRIAAERTARQNTTSAAVSFNGSVSVLTSEDDISGRFPPRVWGRIRGVIASEAHQYAIVNRTVAGQSCITLVYLLEAMVYSVAPLLPSMTVDQWIQRCNKLKAVSEELLHVGLHRLCLAIFPMENILQSISKLRGNEKEVQASSYVKQLVEDMTTLNAKRQVMPTPDLERLLLRHFIFSVQTTLLKEYTKLAKKKLTDALIMQISVDVQSFQQLVGSKFGKAVFVLPDYVTSVIKAGFVEGKEERLEWVRTRHAPYSAADLVQWFSAGDRTMKAQLEELLEQLHHKDAIPIVAFR